MRECKVCKMYTNVMICIFKTHLFKVNFENITVRMQ